MKIEMLDLQSIKPYKNNPRKSIRTIAKVKDSILEYGFKQPIVIDKDKVIIVGHSRFMAATELNLSMVPCLIADDLSDTQIQAYRIADNRIAQDGEWDTDLLAIELSQIQKSDFDFSKTGFSQAELESLHLDPIASTTSLTSITEESQTEQPPDEYVTDSNFANSDEEYVNLNFTLKNLDRKNVFQYLESYRKKHNLSTTSDALVQICKGII